MRGVINKQIVIIGFPLMLAFLTSCVAPQSRVVFFDDFEDGNAFDWYAWNSGIRSGVVRDLNKDEWTVVRSESSYWLQHRYTGGSTGHTDGNFFLTQQKVVNLDKDFTIEWKGKYFDGAEIGAFYIPSEDFYHNPYTGENLPPDTPGPVALGNISIEKGILVLLGASSPIASIPPGFTFTVKIVKRGNIYKAFLNETLIAEVAATLPIHTTGSYKFALRGRGAWGGNDHVLFDYVRITSP